MKKKDAACNLALTAGQEADVMQPSTPSICPTCKSPIAADAPGGLCPACTLEKAASVPHTGIGGRHTPPPSVEEIAPHFPDLEILELLGAGGMGAVYKARQPQLDRTVALKILSHDLSQDPAFLERFNREAKTLARLNHPNIVAVFDFGTAGPYCYLLMEHVDGVNLRQAMRTGGFKPAEALTLVQDVCAALQFAHEEGILHRDIKPENILIDSKGRVKIADFGIAKLVGGGAASDVTLTIQGSVLGSPHYMAPEQIETPGDVDQRADIYSLGVVFYEMLTGELPIGRFALPSEKAAMDERIDEIVLRTLAKERQARFQTAQEVSTRVDALNQSPVPVSHPSTPAAVESGTARFSLLSAILTGLSLVLTAVFAVINVSVNASRMPGQDSYIITGTPMFLIGLPAAIAGCIGFILGASALGAIRKSGGTKDGLGFAIFGVVAWPILVMAVLILFSLSEPMPGSGGSGIPTSLAVLLAGIPLLLASFVLIRGLRRWARGVERKDGQRQFPGLTGTVLATLGLAILGPVLAAVIPGFFSGTDRRADPADVELGMNLVKSETVQWMELSSGLDTDEEVPWRGGKPDLTWKITVASGMKAKLQLLLKDQDGSIRKFPLGDCASQINGSPGHGRLEVGTLLTDGEEPVPATHAMTASFQSGRERQLLTSNEDLRGFYFFGSHPVEILLESAGTQVIPFATRFADKQEVATGTLSLEALVTLKRIGEE